MASAHQEEVGLGDPGIQPLSSDVLETATGGEESAGGLYVVTAAQPSIVTHARVAHFMAPDQLSLLLVRLNRIEIYQVHDEVEGPRGTILSACANLPVFGRIAALEVLSGAAFNERVVARDSIQSGHVDATHESEQHAGSVVQGKTLRSASKRARTSARVRLESSLKVSPERVRHQQPESKTSGKDTDAVFVLTERLEFAVIKFDPVLQGVVTLVAGSLASKLGRRCPLGEFVAVDPDMRCLVVYAYDGLLKVIPGSLMSETFEVRLDVVQVQSMTFLHGTEQPTLAIIHTDYLHNRHLVSYEILLSTQDVRDGPFSQQYLDGSAELIISIPSPSSGLSDGSQSCSFVITGDTSLALYPGRTGVAKQVIHFHSDQFAPMRCFCRINEVCRSRKASVAETALQNRFEAGLDMLTATGYHNHYLLGDREGFLYVLSVGSDVGMRLECVCDTSIASAVAYLGWGYVFVGSTLGDSQLLRLVPSQTESPVQVQTTLSSASLSSPERKGTQSDQTECQLWFGEVVQNYTNIGPIQDLLVTDEDFFSDGHMIACSGVSRMGSLRIIRNGIGFIEHAAVELEGVKALFTLSSLDTPEYDEFLVVSFTAETRVLRLTESDELAEVEALALEEATLLAQRPTTGNSAIWVTPSRVSVIDLTLSEEPTVIWSPSHRDRITNAVMDEVHGLLLVSTSGAHLYIIRLSGKVLEVVGDLALPAEAACMCAAHGIVALGTWAESQIRLYRPHKVAENRWELNCIREEALPSQSVPRSVLLSYLDDQGALPAEQSGKSHLYLLVAVGDGRLFTFTVLPSRRVEREPVKLSDDDDDDDDELCLQHPRQLRLGSRPAALNILQLHGMRYVFAACGRAAVIHAHHGTLLCGNVNLRDVTRAVRFHTRSFPDSIALATEHGLLLGAIEHIQQLHIRRHDLHEQPRRIARLRGCLCLLTVSAMLGEERHHVRLLNDETLESITSYDLSTNEHGLSLIAVPERDIFVVGTAYVLPSEMEPSRGRILVFGRDDLLLLHETNTPGAVYTMSSMAGLEDSMTGSPVTPARLLAAGVNNVVILYAWGQSLHGDDSNLREVTRHLGHVLALRLEARGNLLLVGDLMKSVCLLQLVAAENGTSDRAMPRLKAVAWDYETAWITACTFLNLDQYLAADNSYNLICLRRNPNETRAEFRHALTREGAFHLGDLVNVFRVGKLVTEASGREAPNESNDAEPFPIGSARPNGCQTLLFATTSGAIGVIVPLDPAQYRMLSRLERALRSFAEAPHGPVPVTEGERPNALSIRLGVEGFDHADWRAPLSERALSGLHGPSCFDLPRQGFVDGDLVERFRELELTEMETVAQQVGEPVDRIKHLVDDLARLH